MPDEPTGDSPWWVDDPIHTLHEDRLQRGPFARQIAKVITDIGQTSTTSTVVAVTGPWGSGKTSTLTLALTHLKLKTWHVQWLNPWALSGPDAVTQELLATISEAVPDGDGKEQLRKKIREYGDYATPLLAFLPHIGTGFHALREAAVERAEKNNTLDRQAEALAEEFKAQSGRILVVVDDIDRLQPEELLALFKAVRVLGRLPNVHYLLAFDQDTLLHILTHTGVAQNDESRALAFLEKLVTVRLDQPPTRADQADELLDTGIRRAFAAAECVPTEHQSTRLALEREALLVPLLSEPRKVTRYLAQIHSYLPLVGVNEVDVVDFLVLTFLRLAHPRVYAALAEDQKVLTRQEDETRLLTAWGNRDRLSELLNEAGSFDTQRTAEILQGAIERLFPDITEDAALFLDREQRQRDQRASDPDCVSKYFALNVEADPLTDTVLTDALLAWSGATDATPPDDSASRTVLKAFANTDASERTVPRILRRMTARVPQLDPANCGSVAAFLLTRGDHISRTPSTTEAAVALIANLIVAVPDEAAPDLLERIGNTLQQSVEPPQPSEGAQPPIDPHRWAFTTLVAALRQTSWQPNPSRSEQAAFLASVGGLCIDTAAAILEADLRNGDQAPLNGTTAAIRLLEDTYGSQALERRLIGALDTGITIDTLAATFVELGTDQATGTVILANFDATAFVDRFTPTRIEAEQEHLVTVSQSRTLNDQDITWPSRRATAAQALLGAITPSLLTRRVITPIHRLESYALTDLQANLMPSGGGNLPHLQLGVAFHLGGPLGTHPPSNPMPPEQRENMLLALANNSTISGWLDNHKHLWRIDHLTQWATTDGHPHLWSQVERKTQGAPPADGGPPSEPIEVKMKCEVGATDAASHPTLQLSVVVGFRLANLDVNRELDQRLHNENPVPAALNLVELHGLVVALLRCRETARKLWSDFTDDDPPADSEVQIAARSQNSMSHNIDLRAYERVSEAATSTYSITYNDATESDDYETASAAIQEWANLEGWRGLEADLVQIDHTRR